MKKIVLVLMVFLMMFVSIGSVFAGAAVDEDQEEEETEEMPWLMKIIITLAGAVLIVIGLSQFNSGLPWLMPIL